MKKWTKKVSENRNSDVNDENALKENDEVLKRLHSVKTNERECHLHTQESLTSYVTLVHKMKID